MIDVQSSVPDYEGKSRILIGRKRGSTNGNCHCSQEGKTLGPFLSCKDSKILAIAISWRGRPAAVYGRVSLSVIITSFLQQGLGDCFYEEQDSKHYLLCSV